jgi:DNA modification methylase
VAEQERVSGGADGVLPLRVERVSVASLRVSARNPRRGDVAAIKESLVVNRQYAPVIVNRPTMEVLVGNHRVLAARELGWREIAVCFLEVGDEQARRILLADNRTSDLAGYDPHALLALLSELDGDLVGSGYAEMDLDALLDAVSADGALEDDDVPPLPAEATTRPGDVMLLGEHRLACGDARDAALVERLLEGEPARCLVTDPPYGVGYEGKTRARLRLQNDEPVALERLLGAAFAVADRQLAAGAPVYVFHPTGALLSVFVAAFVGVGWGLRQSLVWVKDAMVLGHADYHFQHESILYGYKPQPGAGRLGRGGAGWYGDARQVSVFELPRPRAAREHPTSKPPELLAAMLRNSSRRGEVVLDPFAGSGSTLVACERLGRRARLVELDARYCDLIVSRYEQVSGRPAGRVEG